MTLYQRGRIWWYDFHYNGQRYRDSTAQTEREDAELVEAQLKLKLRRDAGGVAIIDRKDSPRIVEWAGVYYDHVERNPKISRPDRIDHLLNVVLRFWGAPKNDASKKPGEPYHDLRLLDPVLQPLWIE